MSQSDPFPGQPPQSGFGPVPSPPYGVPPMPPVPPMMPASPEQAQTPSAPPDQSVPPSQPEPTPSYPALTQPESTLSYPASNPSVAGYPPASSVAPPAQSYPSQSYSPGGSPSQSYSPTGSSSQPYPPGGSPSQPWESNTPVAAAPVAGQFAATQSYPPQVGQPGVAQPYPTQPYPGTPGGGYPPVGPPPQTPKKKSPLLFIIIGVVVVALIGALIFWAVSRGKDETTVNGSGGTTSEDGGGAVAAGTPEQAVQGYLEALAAGKSADAVAYASVVPSDDTFITDEVLKAGLAINPITDIKVVDDGRDDKDFAYIDASYVIGTQRVSAHYSLEDFDGKWLLKEATANLNLEYTYEKGVGMSLNGVSLDTVTSLSSVDLLPGTYSFALANPLLTMTDGQFVIEDPSDFASISALDVALAPDAPAKLAAAATAKLDACVAEKDLVTACQFDNKQLEGGAEPDLSTVSWTYKSGSSDFSGATFSYSTYSSATSASANIDVQLTLQVLDTSGTSYGGTQYLYKVTVDFTDPNALVATFS